MNKSQQTIFKIIFFSLLLLRLGFIATTSVIDDEAYYYVYSNHLAGGYIDHGPVVAFLIKIFTAVFGETGFGIRSGSVFLLMFLGFILYKFGEKYFSQVTGVVLSLSVITNVLFHTNSVVMTPDAPLAFFSFLFIISYYLGFFHNKGFFIPAGIFLGLSLLSKISALFPALGVFLFPLLIKSHQKVFKEKYYYLSFVIAFIILSPFIIWNFQNDWAFVRYQGTHIMEAGSIKTFSELWAGVGILLGPFLFIACIILPLKILLKNYFSAKDENPVLVYFAFTSAVPLLYFLIHSSFSQFELNWPAPTFYGGILLFGITAGNDISNRKIFQFIYSLILVVIITVQVYFPILPLQGKTDITNRYFIYSSLQEKLGFFLGQEVQFKNYRILANNYQLPSMINLYLKPELEATCLSIGYHKTLYSFLYPDEQLKGGDYLYITKGKTFPCHLKIYFEEISLLKNFESIRNEESIAEFSLWYVKNYHGKK